MLIPLIKKIIRCLYSLETSLTPSNENTTITTSPSIATSLHDTPEQDHTNCTCNEPICEATTAATSIKTESIVQSHSGAFSNDSILQPHHQDANCCQGCGQAFSLSLHSLRYQRMYSPDLCLGCKIILGFSKDTNLSKRLKRPKKKNSRDHEVNFMKYLHKKDGQKSSAHSETLYHLPLSPNYYRKQRMDTTDNKNQFVFHATITKDNNNIGYFIRCSGCRAFVGIRRKTLFEATQISRCRRGYIWNEENDVASFYDLFKLLVKSNSTCAFSGVKGIWINTPGYPNYPLFSLTLDHKVPLSMGGLSTVDNLQVSLQCLNNIKGSHSNKEFFKWWRAFKQQQGVQNIA